MRGGLLLKVETCVRDNAGGDTGEGTKLGLHSSCCLVVEVRGTGVVVKVVIVVVLVVKEVVVMVRIVAVFLSVYVLCVRCWWWW